MLGAEKIINQAILSQPLGTVLVKEETSSIQFLAIVHELDRTPSWTESWIIQAKF